MTLQMFVDELDLDVIGHEPDLLRTRIAATQARFLMAC
jgi:hypothetical protein